MFKALYADSITLHLIDDDNRESVQALFRGYPDSDEMIAELNENYLPEFENGRRVKYGFYAMLNNELAGMSLLGVDSWKECKGFTGADTFRHMRGKGVTPRSKPHLFYVAFALLGLNRVETGCLVSNVASRRSIEKTAGFQFEGVMRESGLNEQGQFEDQYLYAILRRDWLRLYKDVGVQVIT